MKNVIKFATIVAAVAVMVPAALATCPVDISFGQYPSIAVCAGTTYCYVQTPGSQNWQASFWGLNGGNPTIGLGKDNGNYGWDGTNGSQPWLQGPYAAGWQLNSGWSRGTTDGCSDPDPMLAAISDTAAGGATAYYAVAAAYLDKAAVTQYDFGRGGQNVVLREIPKLTITNSSSGGPGVKNVTVTWTPNATSAFYPEATTVTVDQAIAGYSIWKLEGTSAPTNRAASAWTKVNTVTGSGTATATFTFNCGTTAGNAAWLALGVDFNSGFSTGHVSANSTKINCDPNLADPKTNFKLIDKKPAREVTPKR